jgi:glycosyltransferase involved in cell wall biosynthesis
VNVAFITWTDPRSPRSFSGSHGFMLKALEEHGHRVTTLGPLKSNWLQVGRVANKALRLVASRGTNPIHSWKVAREFAAQLRRKLDGAEVIFAPASSTSIAALETDIPIVYYTDLTFDQIRRDYGKLASLTRRALAEGDEIETSALKKSTVAVFPSQWAMGSATRHYGMSGDKIFKVPMGANLDVAPDAELVTGRKLEGECRLLFVGVDWDRKGGQIALDAVHALRAQGIPAVFTVCGCVPPVTDDCMHVIPFLDKNDPRDKEEFSGLFYESHFFILPTKGDAFPIVLAEASAYGLPSLSSRTGGLEDLVFDGKNGFLLSPASTGVDYATRIAEIWADRAQYARLEESSRKEFDERLNWTHWAQEVSKLFQLSRSMCSGGSCRTSVSFADAACSPPQTTTRCR